MKNQTKSDHCVSSLQENEKTRDIIIDQRFHGTIIGARGENIREIREKFNQVQITFPDQGKKSDIVTLRGPKQDVDRCYKHLQVVHKDMVRRWTLFPCYRQSSVMVQDVGVL